MPAYLFVSDAGLSLRYEACMAETLLTEQTAGLNPSRAKRGNARGHLDSRLMRFVTTGSPHAYEPLAQRRIILEECISKVASEPALLSWEASLVLNIEMEGNLIRCKHMSIISSGERSQHAATSLTSQSTIKSAIWVLRQHVGSSFKTPSLI